jgi:DNA-binding winged helix-turn-helix (wHTH) protein
MRIDEQNGKDSRQIENIGKKGIKIKWSSVWIRSRQKHKEPVHIHSSPSVVAGQEPARCAEPKVSSRTYFIQNPLVSTCQT